MKKQIFTLFIAAVCFTGLQAQNQVKEANVSMSQGSNNALMMELPNTNAEETTKAWKKYIDQYKNEKNKFDKKTNETFTDNTEIKDMSKNTVDVYAQFKQSGPNATMVVWFDLGGAYLSSQMHPDRFPIASKIMSAFALTVSRGMVEEELKAEKKKLETIQDQKKDLEKDKADLEKDIVNLQKDIENYKKKIAEAEQNIEATKVKISKNGDDQGKKQTEVDTQAGKVKEVEKRLENLK